MEEKRVRRAYLTLSILLLTAVAYLAYTVYIVASSDAGILNDFGIVPFILTVVTMRIPMIAGGMTSLSDKGVASTVGCLTALICCVAIHIVSAYIFFSMFVEATRSILLCVIAGAVIAGSCIASCVCIVELPGAVRKYSRFYGSMAFGFLLFRCIAYLFLMLLVNGLTRDPEQDIPILFIILFAVYQFALCAAFVVWDVKTFRKYLEYAQSEQD